MARKRGSRFCKAIDAQAQLEELDQAQQKSRPGKLRKKIDCTPKTEQRFVNSVKQVRKPEVEDEFD